MSISWSEWQRFCALGAKPFQRPRTESRLKNVIDLGLRSLP